MYSAKEEYILFCKQNSYLDVFFQPWLLDCTCEKWDVLIYKQADGSQAFMPYNKHKKYGFTTIVSPHLTAHNGVIFDYKGEDKTRQVFEDKAYSYFAKQLKDMQIAACFYTLQSSNTYPQELLDYGFEIKRRVTYKTDLNNQNLLQSFSSRRRTQIHSASKYITISKCNLSISEVYSLLCQTFVRQGIKIPYNESFFSKLLQTLRSHNQGEVYQALDREGNLHAILFAVWDKTTCYNMATTTIDKYKKSNALALLHYTIMLEMQTKKLAFYDFEGSMIEPIARYFKTFGSKQYEYFSLVKYYNKIYKLLFTLKHR